MPTAQPYLHYGWPSSPYSAKSRAALRVSGLPWAEVQPNALTFSWLQSQVGRKIIPVAQTPDGRFLQDSSRLVDAFEAASGLPLTPSGGLARVVALWIEVFADEWMIYPAMYFRWCYKGGGFDYMVEDFGRCGLPGLPAAVQRKAGLNVAQAMSRYLPIMGIDETTGPAIEAETRTLLAQLEAHLETSPYLLGKSPCIADFALYGTPAAHIGRDPWSAEVIEAHPRVRAWIENLHLGTGRPQRLQLDTISPTLAALLQTMFRIGAPAWAETHRLARAQRGGPGETLRRRVGVFEAKLECEGKTVIHPHKLTAVTAWKIQRPLKAMAAMGEALPREALEAVGAGPLMQLEPMPKFDLEHIAFRQDPTTFGLLGSIVDRITPTLRRAPNVRPLHPKPLGPVDGLG